MGKFSTSNFTKSILALSLLVQVACSNEAIEETEDIATDAVATEVDEAQAAKPWDNDPSKPEHGGTYYIANVHSGKFLDVKGYSKNNGANVYQWNYTGAKNQQWKLIQYNNRTVLQSVNSGKCLDIAYMSEKNGGNAHQWGFWGGDNQLWILGNLPNTFEYYITNENSGYPLEVAGYKTGDSANVQQWERSRNGHNQRWYFIPI